MRKYTKIIILSSVLLALIVLITLAMVFDVDMGIFKNLSIAGIQEKKLSVEELMQKQQIEEANNTQAKSQLTSSKNSFDVAKSNYENIDEDTIKIVQDATKEVKYFIEYLWIVLGNYAAANDIAISIITPGSTMAQKPSEDSQDTEDDLGIAEGPSLNENSPLTSGVKVTIEGRYANIADFVFDVENDKSLKFKLDNISMTYSGDNKVEATFDVLSLSVLK